MYQTSYHRPTSLAEAASLLASAEDAKLLAGGMTLIPTMKQRLAAPANLVDLGRIAELKGITAAGGSPLATSLARAASNSAESRWAPR